MAIKYPGQTLQQYGNATVIQMGKADAAQRTAIAATQQAQLNKAKQKAAAAKAKQDLEKNMFDVDFDGVRASDSPYIQEEYNKLKSYYQQNSNAYHAGDTEVISELNGMKSSLLNKTVASKQENKREGTEYGKVLTEGYNSDYNNEQFDKKLNTSMFGASAQDWNGYTNSETGEEVFGIGNFQLYEDLDFGEYYKDFKVNEQIISNVEAIDMGTSSVAGYLVDMEPAEQALFAQGASAYSQIKENPAAVMKFKQTYDNPTFLSNLPESIQNAYEKEEEKGDMDGMMTALSAGQVYLASDNKDLFKMTALPTGGIGPNITTDGDYFVYGKEPSIGYYLPMPTPRGISDGRGSSGSISFDFNDSKDQTRVAGIFGYLGDDAWSQWTKDSGFKDAGDYGTMGVRTSNRLSFNLPKGAEGAQNKLEMSSVPYTRTSFKGGQGDEVTKSGPVDGGSVSMSINSVSTRDVYDKNIDLVILPSGEVVSYNEGLKGTGYRINAKKGDFIPKIFFDSKNPSILKSLQDGGYLASGTGVPVIEGRNDDGFDIAIEIPFIREGENKGDLDRNSLIYKRLMNWYTVSLSDAKKFSQEEMDKFKKELDNMAPKVR
mgnify:FL=1